MNRAIFRALLWSVLGAVLGTYDDFARAQIVISSDTTIATPMEGNVHIVSPSASPTTVQVRQPALFMPNLEVFDHSIVNFHGGLVSGELLAHEASVVNILGGSFDDVIADGAATLNISGGHIDDLLLAEDMSIVNIVGGSIEAAKGSHESRMFISGGFVDGMVTEHSASILITGSGFNHPYGQLEPRFGVLSGTLANGDPINASFNINGGSIVLVAVPEPMGVLVGGVVAGVLVLRRRTRVRSRCGKDIAG